jgi:hypothetical protein
VTGEEEDMAQQTTVSEHDLKRHTGQVRDKLDDLR